MPTYPQVINPILNTGPNAGSFPCFWNPASDIPHINGNNWFIVTVTDTSIANIFAQAWKSTDQGATWTQVGSGPQLSNRTHELKHLHVRQNGTILYIGYVAVGGGATIGRFDMAAQNWLAPFTGGPAVGVPTGTEDDDGGPRVLLEIMADNSFVLLCTGPPFGALLRARVNYVTCSAGGVWGGVTALPAPNATSGYFPNGLVIASATHVDLFIAECLTGIGVFPIPKSYSVQHLAVNNGVLNAAYDLVLDDALPMREPSIGYPILIGTLIAIPYEGVFNNVFPVVFNNHTNVGCAKVVTGTSGDTPVWTTKQINVNQADGPAAGTFAIVGGAYTSANTTLNFLWNNQALNAFLRSNSTDLGVTWSAPAIAIPANADGLSDYERPNVGLMANGGIAVVYQDFDGNGT